MATKYQVGLEITADGTDQAAAGVGSVNSQIAKLADYSEEGAAAAAGLSRELDAIKKAEAANAALQGLARATEDLSAALAEADAKSAELVAQQRAATAANDAAEQSFLDQTIAMERLVQEGDGLRAALAASSAATKASAADAERAAAAQKELKAAIAANAAALKAEKAELDKRAAALKAAGAESAKLATATQRQAAIVAELKNREAELAVEYGKAANRAKAAGLDTANLTRNSVTLAGRMAELRQRIAETSAQHGRAAEAAKKHAAANKEAANSAGGLKDALGGIKSQLGALVGGYAALQAGQSIAAQADQWSLLQARIKLSAESGQEYEDVSGRLFDLSQDTRSELGSVVGMYQKLDMAQRTTGLSTQENLRLTETLAKSLKISGANTSEAASLQTQFAQAMNSGVLRGDEFNSVMENGGRVVKALSDALGKSVGELRQMAEEGKLTADIVSNALLQQSEIIDKEYARIPITIEGSVQKLRNTWMKFIGEQDQATGASANLAKGIEAISQNLDEIVSVASTAGQVIVASYAVKGVQAMGSFAAAAGGVATALKAIRLAGAVVIIDQLFELAKITVEYVDAANSAAKATENFEKGQAKQAETLAEANRQLGAVIPTYTALFLAMKDGDVRLNKQTGQWEALTDGIKKYQQTATPAGQRIIDTWKAVATSQESAAQKAVTLQWAIDQLVGGDLVQLEQQTAALGLSQGELANVQDLLAKRTAKLNEEQNRSKGLYVDPAALGKLQNQAAQIENTAKFNEDLSNAQLAVAQSSQRIATAKNDEAVALQSAANVAAASLQIANQKAATDRDELAVAQEKLLILAKESAADAQAAAALAPKIALAAQDVTVKQQQVEASNQLAIAAAAEAGAARATAASYGDQSALVKTLAASYQAAKTELDRVTAAHKENKASLGEVQAAQQAATEAQNRYRDAQRDGRADELALIDIRRSGLSESRKQSDIEYEISDRLRKAKAAATEEERQFQIERGKSLARQLKDASDSYSAYEKFVKIQQEAGTKSAAEADKAAAQTDKLAKSADALAKERQITVAANLDQAESELTKIEGRLNKLIGKEWVIKVRAETSGSAAQGLLDELAAESRL